MNDVTGEQHIRRARGLIMSFALPITLAACMGGAGPGAREPQAGMLTDAEIAAVLDAANRGEIEQSELARQRADATSVRGFATAMVAGHRSAIEQQQRILEERNITPRPSPMSRRIEERRTQTMQSLEGLSGEEFDRAYMQMQMQQHQDLLSLLDEQLIPNAGDPTYRMFLEQLRSDIAQHLTNAQRVHETAVAG